MGAMATKHFIFNRQALTDSGRNSLLTNAQVHGASHILFLIFRRESLFNTSNKEHRPKNRVPNLIGLCDQIGILR